MNGPVLEVTDLVKHYPGPGRGRVVHAVDGVSLTVGHGEVLGLVGESGSGKSTLGRCVLRLTEPDSGTVRLAGRDITHLSRRALLPLRREAHMVFQDPFSSLNPRMTVGETLDEALATHGSASSRERAASVRELLELVRLKSAVVDQYPSHMSGGMRQRVAIARCLAVRPRLIVADEITSALDASVQGAVLNLLRELQRDLELSVLFITHNLAVVRYIAGRTAVMRHGQVVEEGDSDGIVRDPRHPYTRELVEAIPRIENAGTDRLLRTIGA